jgi:hypothetical protein
MNKRKPKTECLRKNAHLFVLPSTDLVRDTNGGDGRRRMAGMPLSRLMTALADPFTDRMRGETRCASLSSTLTGEEWANAYVAVPVR